MKGLEIIRTTDVEIIRTTDVRVNGIDFKTDDNSASILEMGLLGEGKMRISFTEVNFNDEDFEHEIKKLGYQVMYENGLMYVKLEGLRSFNPMPFDPLANYDEIDLIIQENKEKYNEFYNKVTPVINKFI